MQTEVLLVRESHLSLLVGVHGPARRYLVESAIRAGVQGNRGELFAQEVARASAALRTSAAECTPDAEIGGGALCNAEPIRL